MAAAALAATGAVVTRQPLSGHVPPAVARMTPTGRLPATTNLHLALSLPLRNRDVLTNLLAQLYDPASTNFHHYLQPAEFAARFGPTEEDYQAVIAHLQSHGLTVTATHPNRVVLDVAGAVADIEKTFQVALRVYPHPTEARTFYAPDTEPSLALAVPVLHVSGLDNFAPPRPRLHQNFTSPSANAKPRAGSGPGGGYMGNDFRAAYFPGVTLTGSGQSVGLLQFDGYDASDIAYYETNAGLPNVTLTNVLLDGFDGVPSGDDNRQLEVSLDIEMAISMAPGLNRVIVYEAGPTGNWYDILNRMATDNLAQQLSCSWYVPGGTADTTADIIFQQMAAQGQSFYSASGDHDAFVGEPDFPSESPFITQVGGTTLTTTPGGAWSAETVWNWGYVPAVTNYLGSGGGISTYYAIPDWQQGVSMTNNQGSTTLRNIPDVALTADNVYVRAKHADQNVGGTSCAAPLWAALTALMNELAATNGQPPVGFVNPAVYAFCQSSNYASAFHDIATGNNESTNSPAEFTATNGYDLCTGWGTPNGGRLLEAIGLPEPLRITPGTAMIFSGPVGGPFTPALQSYSLTNGGASPLSWSLLSTSIWLNVSPTGGGLTPGGVPAAAYLGVSTAANALPPGSYTGELWFTNLTDNSGQRRKFTVVVATPPVITAQPTNQAALQGTTATFTVTATGTAPLSFRWRQNGTNLTDAGEFSGTATATLTVSNVSPADAGIYSVTVSNILASTTSTGTVLTVLVPPAITTQPTNQAVLQGLTAMFTVTATSTAPLSFQWQQNDTNLTDAGEFSGTATATLTVSNLSPADAGIYSVTVSNDLGFVTSTGAVLTVLVPPAITLQPTDLTVLPGQTATFTAAADGDFPLFYQWQFNGANLADDGNVSGSATASLVINNVSPANAGTYSVTASNAFASAISSNAVLTVIPVTTPGTVLTTLFLFTGDNDGGHPNGLVLHTNGIFYGTTQSGGDNFSGTVFQMAAGGTPGTLHSFNGDDGNLPHAGLVQNNDGNLYGTTLHGGTNGGDGTVFLITTNGALTSLHSFTDGDGGGRLYGSLARGDDGNFYGTTYEGGTNGEGTVFRISANGALTSLHSFNGDDGDSPKAALVKGRDGVIYGTTESGGTNGDFGTVFRITTNGAITSLHSFNGDDGDSPEAALVQASDGSLYGTTRDGGTNDNGTLFKITTNGAFTLLHSFTGGGDGGSPSGALMAANDGNLYGTTSNGGVYGDGTIFKITTNGALTTLAWFDGYNGANPAAALVAGADGYFYGTTQNGGINGNGVIFRLAPPWPPVISTVTKTNGNFTLTWTALAGRSYQLQYTANLTLTNWINLGTPLTAITNTATAPDTISKAQRFYRVKLLP